MGESLSFTVSSFRHHVSFLRGFPCGEDVKSFDYGYTTSLMRAVNHVSGEVWDADPEQQIQRQRDSAVNRNRRAGICHRLRPLYDQPRGGGFMGGAQEGTWTETSVSS